MKIIITIEHESELRHDARLEYVRRQIKNCEMFHEQGCLTKRDYVWYMELQLELKELEE